MSVAQESESKVSPLVIIAAIVAVLAVAGAVAWNFSRPNTASKSEIATIAKELQAPAGTPTVPPGAVAADVMTRGGSKNTGK